MSDPSVAVAEAFNSDFVNVQGYIKMDHPFTRFAESALVGKTLCPLEDFYFEGAEGKQVHGYVVKPYEWREGDLKKWPGLFFIHGGMSARRGMSFVVVINPTGSTTFDQDKYPEIDPDRAVAAGATDSWGGYAINWIQGHPEYGFNLKALAVCHDGVFDTTYNGYSAEELFFWSTPQLVIHRSKDYCLPEMDGISAFHTFQQCAYLRVSWLDSILSMTAGEGWQLD
ncbi:hypothetical protein BJV78DRAFT_1281739 [Lactifluus subvellereus]|nr:hypothetical protein BJV78DRAFT_1281739 [Lactifluus subvellereus]